MKVLFVTNYYPPHSTGGYDIACHAMATQLMTRGHEIAVVTSRYGVPADAASEQGIARALHRPQDSASLMQLVAWESADLRFLAEKLGAFPPDVVYAWNLLQLFPSVHRALKDARAPVVYNIQDSWIPRHLQSAEERRNAWHAPGGGLRGLARRATGRLLQGLGRGERPATVDDVPLEHVIFCSGYQHEQHLALGLPLGEGPVIQNGVDLTLFDGQASPRSHEGLRALFVGRMVPDKGAHVAVEAVRRARAGGLDVRLTLAGISTFPWEYEENLRREAARPPLDGAVSFVGAVANRDLPALHAAHDVLVFPSAHLEGLPMTVIEAMASGLPVLGTLTGGTGEALQHDVNGLVFQVGDVEGLKTHLVTVARSDDLRRRLRDAALHTARTRFDVKRKAEETEAYFEAVVTAWRKGDLSGAAGSSNPR
jgi:glycogen synthase